MSNAPAITPSTGFVNIVRMLAKPASVRKPETAADIVSMPNISTEKPRSITPISRFLPDFAPIYSRIPMSERMGVKEEGLSISIYHAFPSSPERLSTQDVIVVPTFAPMITLIACESVSKPELTKPTTITVVAEED